MLDEFTALGSLEFLARAIAYLWGYGVRVFISTQSLSQLSAVYGQHPSITANCALCLMLVVKQPRRAGLVTV